MSLLVGDAHIRSSLLCNPEESLMTFPGRQSAARQLHGRDVIASSTIKQFHKARAGDSSRTDSGRALGRRGDDISVVSRTFRPTPAWDVQVAFLNLLPLRWAILASQAGLFGLLVWIVHPGTTMRNTKSTNFSKHVMCWRSACHFTEYYWGCC